MAGGLRLLTEPMTEVRSVTIGVWLARGSRHESDAESGIAHFVEHMLFKGTTSRSAQAIAEQIDSIGGQLDAFTAKEYAAYYIRVLDEHLPIAVELLADMVMRPAMTADDVAKEQGVILEEIKMVEDAPDDLVHEVFTRHFWVDHPLGRPILGTPETVSSFSSPGLRDYFGRTYTAPNLIVAAAGNFEHAYLRDLVQKAFADLPTHTPAYPTAAPLITRGLSVRHKDIEQSHVCLGTGALSQGHDDRHVAYVLNTILGGSMSSRLFQHIREERGLAYAVFSNLTAYSDAGMLTVYAGCAADKVGEVIDLTLAELRGVRDAVVTKEELRRAKDHLKGSLMLSLESTSSRMSHLARQELYFTRHYTMDETLASIENVTAEDVQRVAIDMFRDEHLSATIVGPDHSPLDAGRLKL
ncbi:MAG: pitrilysin family protein [Acidobacteriota bacterium]